MHFKHFMVTFLFALLIIASHVLHLSDGHFEQINDEGFVALMKY